jgi:hypothetical protein
MIQGLNQNFETIIFIFIYTLIDCDKLIIKHKLSRDNPIRLASSFIIHIDIDQI